MAETQRSRIAADARRCAKALGYQFDDDALEALLDWVTAVESSGTAKEAISEEVARFVEAMVYHSPAGSSRLGKAEFHAALLALGRGGQRKRARGSTSGRVRWLDDEKGFGFITADDGRDVIVHYGAIPGSGFKALAKGARVEFTIVEGEGGPSAENVSLAETSPREAPDGDDRGAGGLRPRPAAGKKSRRRASPGTGGEARGGLESAAESPLESAPWSGEESGGLESLPADGGLEAAPADGGLESAPADGGLESAPADGGLKSTPASGREDPPRSAYALLDAPGTVVAEEAFDVTVGLSAERAAGVIGEQLVLPEATVYPYTLGLQLVAEGFELADAGAWRREVTATADAPYPNTVFRLRALPQAEPVHPRALQVLYSIGGHTIGFAVRPIAVVRTAADRKAAPPAEHAPAVDIRVPTELVAPDITIHILRDHDVRERLLWTVESPHPGIAWTTDDGKPVSCDIGDQPREFARQVVQQVNQHEGKPTLKFQMQGIGKRIAGKIPEPVWEAIHAAARAAGGPPSILLLSEEPYVPWELALVPDPLPDPSAPKFLGAQAHVGRWILAQPGPGMPPPHALGVASMAVVWGVYNSSRWGRLEAAEQEAAALRQAYGAESVDATIAPVLRCLEGTPAAHALHFAIHGVYNPGGIQDGLVLADEQTISPVMVSGADLPGRPFVFLNACQVGSGQEVLGDYAGMASAFLDAHASAVIAPLWSVKDTIAKEISLSFYTQAFGGEPVASVLRRQRAKYGEDGSATHLAYQYFGHPELRISRPAPSA